MALGPHHLSRDGPDTGMCGILAARAGQRDDSGSSVAFVQNLLNSLVVSVLLDLQMIWVPRKLIVAKWNNDLTRLLWDCSLESTWLQPSRPTGQQRGFWW